ncbi:MAG: Holliday junction resolvase RuvX, partial [Bacilli bacterium]|nr:Holliday junction resolvase RuvX [Bacilli bacterium]
ENYRFTDGAYRQVLAYILEYLKKENVGVVALGYPLNMDGSKGESAFRSERFKEELLEADPNLKVFLVDERLTTVMANRSMLEADISRGKRHKVIDQQSAVIILESFLNSPEAKTL